MKRVEKMWEAMNCPSVSVSKAAPCVTDDFTGLIYFWRQNFSSAKCITASLRFIFGSKITEQIEQIRTVATLCSPCVLDVEIAPEENPVYVWTLNYRLCLHESFLEQQHCEHHKSPEIMAKILMGYVSIRQI